MKLSKLKTLEPGTVVQVRPEYWNELLRTSFGIVFRVYKSKSRLTVMFRTAERDIKATLLYTDCEVIGFAFWIPEEAARARKDYREKKARIPKDDN